MSRWIDADALKKSIDDCDICNICPDKNVRCDYDCDFPDYLTPKWETLIDNAPSIDIVRCAECKYWEESQYYQGFMVCTYVKGATFTRQHDDFCSRGEREGE